MDGLANVAKMQQTQIDTQSNATSSNIQKISSATTEDFQNNQQKADNSSSMQVDSENDVKKLVDELNSTMSQINKDLKFGVDDNDIFYVSVIDTKSNTMIRRFPAEKAADFLPKMKEVTGILFDSKG